MQLFNFLKRKPMTYKEQMLEAIRKLIYNYENLIAEHNVETCPLCKLCLKREYDIEQSLLACKTCPNTVFGKVDDERPCHERGTMFPKLDFAEENTSDTLADYWRLVEALIESKTEEEILEMGTLLQAEILEIAKGFTTEETTEETN